MLTRTFFDFSYFVLVVVGNVGIKVRRGLELVIVITALVFPVLSSSRPKCCFVISSTKVGSITLFAGTKTG